ncbi:MAG: DUF1254 domain-containing protein [Candidatus Micrarchaeaceae archaeon]
MNKSLRIFIITLIAIWVIGTIAYIYFLPNIIYNGVYNLVIGNGVEPGGVPADTLYTLPTLGSPSSNSFLVNTGSNRDTLYTVGVLNLSGGPKILHVPSIPISYYSIEFFDSHGDDFAELGVRTAYQAGNYLITGPGWQGQVPQNMTRIASPADRAFLIGRVLVENESDLPVVYNLSKQIRLTPLNS